MFPEGVGVNLQQGTTLPTVTVAVKCSVCPDTEGLMKAHRCDRVRLFSRKEGWSRSVRVIRQAVKMFTPLSFSYGQRLHNR